VEDRLRDFLKREFGDQIKGVPLHLLVGACYRELLRRADMGHYGDTSAHAYRERLFQIAREVVRRLEGGSGMDGKLPERPGGS